MGTPSAKGQDLLIVTSFNREMYEASGSRLLTSFKRVKQHGDLLICGEGFKPGAFRGFHYQNLDEDGFLHKWLAENRDVIPAHLGGTTTQCRCPNSHIMHSPDHVKGCHWHWMNRNASRWFRKVASLRLATKMSFRYLLWLDADTYFIRQVPLNYLLGELNNRALFYFKGHRPAVESGILFFDLENGGRSFIKALCERYTSKKYRDYERWDDGYQIAMLIKEGVTTARDLVHPTRWQGKTTHVIPTTNIATYLVHDKGRHGRILGIMK